MYAHLGSVAVARLALRFTRELLRVSLTRSGSQSAHAAAARWDKKETGGSPRNVKEAACILWKLSSPERQPTVGGKACLAFVAR